MGPGGQNHRGPSLFPANLVVILRATHRARADTLPKFEVVSRSTFPGPLAVRVHRHADMAG